MKEDLYLSWDRGRAEVRMREGECVPFWESGGRIKGVLTEFYFVAYIYA